MTQHDIAKYQSKVFDMVAPQNLSRKPKKTKRKHTCTKSPWRDSHGVAQSKTLRKREKRLWARQQAWATSQNSARDNNQNPSGYRKPGSMKK